MGRMQWATSGGYVNYVKGRTGVARGGTAIDSAYPSTNLWDDLPVTFMLVAGGSPGVLVLEYDIGTAVTIQRAAVLNHNIRDATAMHLFANTVANDWGAPTHSVTFPRTTRPLASIDEYYANPWVDLSSIPARRYWALAVGVSGSDANDVPIKIGEFQLVASINTLTHNPNWGLKEVQTYPGTVLNTTVSGVVWPKRSDGYQRRLSGVIETTDAGVESLLSCYHAARGRERPFLLIPDDAVRDAWLVHWSIDYDRAFQYINDNVVTVDWIEAARGGELLTNSL